MAFNKHVGKFSNSKKLYEITMVIKLIISDSTKIIELCLRSYQTGAFLPFMMSYYDTGNIPRHPIDFSTSFLEQLK